MLDALAKIGPIAVSIVGAAVAVLVYRLNSDKLFLDMVTARREAVRQVFDTAQARQTEGAAMDVNAWQSGGFDLPEQSRFWRAKDHAEGLFGVEVGRRLNELDKALGDVMGTRFAARGHQVDDKQRRETMAEYSAALHRLEAARQAVSECVKPYISLGRRGLPFSVRYRLRRTR